MVLNIENIVAELEIAAISELSKLVKAIEEKFDVPVAVPAVVARPAAGGATEEQTEFIVELITAGDQKVEAIKAVREATGLGLKGARVVADDVPAPVKEAVSKEEAEASGTVLEEVGALATIK